MRANEPPMPRHIALARGWLLAGFALQIVLGHLVAFGLGGPLFAWHQERVAEALWGVAEYDAHAAAYRGWIAALLGGTMVSYAWAMLFIAAVPLRRRERWAGWAIAIATLNWFAIDTALSAAHGVWINVAFNVSALAMTAIPLAITVPWLKPACP
jgi:hypothetical protein